MVTEQVLTERALEWDEKALAGAVKDNVNAAHRTLGEQAVDLTIEAFGENSPVTARMRAEADVHVAVDAARSMNVAGGAFGLMCASLVPLVMATSTLMSGVSEELVRIVADLDDQHGQFIGPTANSKPKPQPTRPPPRDSHRQWVWA